MPDYYYVCANRDGHFFQGACTAGDEQELTRILARRRLYMLWSEEKFREDPEERAITRLVLYPIELSEVVTLLIRRSQGHRLRGFPTTVPPLLDPLASAPAGEAATAAEAGPAPVAEADRAPAAPPAHRSPSSRRRILISWTLAAACSAFWLAKPLASWKENRQARARHRQASADMERIATAAREVYHAGGHYPPPEMPGVLPRGVERSLPEWPAPPCPDWSYTWDHWTAGAGLPRTLRVTLRDAQLYSVYYLCVNETDCASPTMWGQGQPLEQAPGRRIRCDERRPA